MQQRGHHKQLLHKRQESGENYQIIDGHLSEDHPTTSLIIEEAKGWKHIANVMGVTWKIMKLTLKLTRDDVQDRPVDLLDKLTIKATTKYQVMLFPSNVKIKISVTGQRGL